LSSAWSWVEKAELYAELVLEKLAGRGVDIRNKIEFIRIITPDEISVRTGSWLGALYGRSSNNRLAAFRRPHNRSKKVRGLYYAGGTTHPGGGIPMVMLSGKVAADLLLEDWNKHDSL
jgi:phytoene dehydrogenase-like protein